MVCAVLLAVAGALLWPVPPASAAETARLRLVRTIHTSAFTPSSPDPSGIVYRPGRNRLLIADSEVDETRRYRGSNLFTARRRGSGFGSGTLLPANREPADLGFNPKSGALFASNDDKDRISRVRPGRDGVHGTADDKVSNFNTAAFGSTDPEGVEYDPGTGRLYVCDGLDREVYAVTPRHGRVISRFDLARYGARDCEGLGIDPKGRNSLLAVDWRTNTIYRLSRGGDLRRKLRLSAIPTTHSVVADVTMAPTSKRKDKPSRMNYWIVDRHVDNKGHPNENDGLLYEMSVRRRR
jgi:DNA-binding beta-propeller fold protein YncE